MDLNISFLFFIISLLHTKLIAYNIDIKPVAYLTSDSEISKLNLESSYFGYSLATYRSNNSYWLLVGAPKSNLSANGPISPGVVHSCQLSDMNATCKLFYYQYKDEISQGRDQMFGATMVSHYSEGTNEVIACGFKKTFKTEDNLVCPGACSVFRDEKNTETFKAHGEIVLNSSYLSKFAQMGFSLHKISKDQRQFYGTPGVMSWKGGVSILTKGMPCYFYNMSGGNFELSGYAVTSLTINGGRPLMVLGVPKHQNHGKITILDIDDDCDATLIQDIIGSCFGSMFGSSLLALDVDGDGTDEILVGAPFYNTTKGDEGAVFVYKEVEGTYKQVAMLSGSGRRGSRFGTTLHSVDDINMDGFNDVIIGSPYEGQGVAYLYLGTNETFQNKYSQMIEASTIGQNLMRFGYSFQVIPLTGSYGGLAVGAYLSDQVVLMKIRPRHSINGNIQFHPQHVPWNPSDCIEFYNQTSTINVSIIFDYIIPKKELEKFRNQFFRDAEIIYELLVDYQHRRGFLVDKEHTKFDKTIEKIIFSKNKMTVVRNWTINFDIKKQPLFVSQPVSFKLNISISKYDEEINPFIELTQIRRWKIPFHSEPTTFQCRPNITYNLRSKRHLIAGASSTAILEVFVCNHGDSSLHTEFKLNHTLFLRLMKITENFIKCNKSGEDVHYCEINELLLKDSCLFFEIHFALKKGWSGTSIEIQFVPSLEHGKIEKIDLLSWYRSEIVVIRASNESINDSSHEIRHYYDIRNNGPGLHRTLSLQILVPTSSSVCCMTILVEIDIKKKFQAKNSTILEISNVIDNLYSENLTQTNLFVSNMTCANVDCQTYQLEVTDMSPEDTMDLRVNITISGSLSVYLKKLKKFTYESQISLQPNLINETQISFETSKEYRSRLDVNIKSILVSPSNDKQIPLWLLLTCLLIGFTHFVVLILVLKKCGFFRRKGREKLEEEKHLMNRKRASQNPDIVEDELIEKTFL